MVDLTDFLGADKQRASLVKKRVKAQEKLVKVLEKAAPLQVEVKMYDQMIFAMDEAAGKLEKPIEYYQTKKDGSLSDSQAAER